MRNSFRQVIAVAIILVALFVYFSIRVEGFATGDNLANIARRGAINGIISTGMTLIIITGGIDLSVGSVLALCGVVMAIVMKSTGTVCGVFCGIGVGMLCGLCNGLVVGTVALLVAWAWSANPSMGIAVGLAMLGTIVMASLAGSVIPMVLRGMGLDPAQASSIFLLTLTDMTGFAIFLGLASALRTLLAA